MKSTFCFTNVKTLKIVVKQEEAFVVNIFRSGGKHQSLRQFTEQWWNGLGHHGTDPRNIHVTFGLFGSSMLIEIQARYLDKYLMNFRMFNLNFKKFGEPHFFSDFSHFIVCSNTYRHFPTLCTILRRPKLDTR